MAHTNKQHDPGSAALALIVEARHHDPFAVLGTHAGTIRLYLPHTRSAHLTATGAPFSRLGESDFFEWHGDTSSVPRPVAITRIDEQGVSHHEHDPYSFPPLLADFDIHLFNGGKHWHLYRILGAHPCTVEGVSGVRFATWAPTAERISVIGNFNLWDGRRHPMRVHGSSGVWELFIPGLGDGELYKFEIRNRHTGAVVKKIDPYGQYFERRPHTAAITYQSTHTWEDSAWLQQREERHWMSHPISIYEVHLGSWQRDAEGAFLGYRELAERLVSHVKQMGFTHIELLPITEHPLDDSWGYQTTGYFAPTSRFGSPDDFRYFVDYCHRHHVGVYLDWVPAHFPKDGHALANFDGSALYEHADPRQGEHPDWGTLIYNFGRNEVKNFLLASANFWLEEFHIDGLRVDAVASMLYLDYSREGDNWIPNIHGGNENLEAIAFLRELNVLTHSRHPGTVVMAEESTAWPQVTRPVELGGLGFSMKWNMGWMHDSLGYLIHDPIHRSYHHDQLTFGLLYLFQENFILPFSHDEVVHGKGSMLNKMPGDEWQRFANLRLLYTYLFTYPGKKLLFMGTEFGQGNEWNFGRGLDWHHLDYPLHQGVSRLVADLNRLYVSQPALHRFDFEPQGFEWIDCHDATQSVLSYLRKGESGCYIVILNFTPVVHHDYRIGVPHAGAYHEALNSDSGYYQGSNTGNDGVLMSEACAWMGRPYSLSLTLPPLGALILEWRP
jgi:1,4-alpha-glucan branching enzyme